MNFFFVFSNFNMDTHLFRIFVFYFVCIITTKAGRVFRILNFVWGKFDKFDRIICVWTFYVCDVNVFAHIGTRNWWDFSLKIITNCLYLFENWACAYQKICWMLFAFQRYTHHTHSRSSLVCIHYVSTIISCERSFASYRLVRVCICWWFVRGALHTVFFGIVKLTDRIGSSV